ncbi:thiamine pyrophosphate enzyme, N-terminal TPP binding domain-containing protein [Suillus subalutaceus]|uniref:thiamine pyrophosphate enzyme, N-terminal TPP binding domain-containing protein n=1 Tax=Suillus subalutaceus TaxID=48586 RepID=UPI001B8844F8|nr:thiamine pyrophosphate enzyme, N-terminal TPP binding domain-containing protein [Suillus subalutaceus]KAG1826595.1 thiamine pyrophosphate enzyme, N-terminal TPP binding domain-containing protein [Suillus subalutaceus]
MYTTSSLFFHTLAQVGITHAFVNWGSDHPALLEDLQRQRVDHGDTVVEIITCPNEMAALSAAQAFVQVTNTPAAVIVHVDVGTQALAGAVHNASRGKVPILVFAGASPSTVEGELKGSRNEWIHWMQDIPDQPAIVRQYMRFTAQINAPENVPHLVRRALQIATSEPKGPVYLWARREVLEQEIDESLFNTPASLCRWPSIEPSGLSPSAVNVIGDALAHANNPLIITSYIGRNPAARYKCLSLASILRGRFLPRTWNTHSLLSTADVILVIDAEVPWIPMNKDNQGNFERPSDEARIFVIDSGDPLKETIGMEHVAGVAEVVCRASADVMLYQLLNSGRTGAATGFYTRSRNIQAIHDAFIADMRNAETLAFEPNVPYLPSRIFGALRTAVENKVPHPASTLYLNETISNYPLSWSHLHPDTPAGMLSSGGSSLGWALGASVGAVLGGVNAGKGAGKVGYELVVSVVGDGTFLFGVPSSAFWMARRYETPFLTIVLNNGGWKSPKLSMLGVHPEGHGSKVTGNQLTVGLGPVMPDYVGIAVAATGGWAWGKRIAAGDPLGETMAEAVRIVVEERRCAIVECVLESI